MLDEQRRCAGSDVTLGRDRLPHERLGVALERSGQRGGLDGREQVELLLDRLKGSFDLVDFDR